MPREFLLDLLQRRHPSPRFNRVALKGIFDRGLQGIDEPCKFLRCTSLSVYYATRIGHDADSIGDQIHFHYTQRGIRQFKLKTSTNIEHGVAKIRSIASLVPSGVVLCVDANQTLSIDDAKQWMAVLSELGVLRLEEPFAPDNTQLFADLVRAKKENGWSCEVVTGENFPNHYTAASLIASGIDRFQADPCRILGLIDTVLTSCIAKIDGCNITPHAGGSSLDEQSLNIQLFNLARVFTELSPMASLIENVGFCSNYFAAPRVVHHGITITQCAPGLLVGLDPQVQPITLNY